MSDLGGRLAFCQKNFGRGAKDNRSFFLKTIGCCFYCFSVISLNFLGGGNVMLGAPPVAESQRGG